MLLMLLLPQQLQLTNILTAKEVWKLCVYLASAPCSCFTRIIESRWYHCASLLSVIGSVRLPLLQTAGAKKVEAQWARAGCLEALWGTVVEGDLFASSNERKYLGFQLFTILLPHLR